MNRIYFTLFALFFSLAAIAQTAQVQVIHNSPTVGSMNEGPIVDIYVNGALLPELTGVPFRAATSFLPVASGIDIEVAVALNPSTSVDDAIATFPLGQLTDGENYIVIANGIVGDIDNPFNLEVKAMAKTAATDPGTVEFIAFHGAPGAPNVDIDARGVGTLVSDLAFGSFDDYIPVPPASYLLDIRAAGDPNIVATFEADLSGLTGGAATVFASGLLGGMPAFGLFAALPDGTVVELPATAVARLQVIHNSPSPTVDIYANGDLLVPDFEFRTATPFIDVPAGVNIDIAVAPGDSGSAGDAIATFPVTFDNGSTYVVVANGIVGDMDNPFGLVINDMGQEAAGDPATVDVAAFHGSPGAPNVDVDVRGGSTLFSDVAYGSFTDYAAVPADSYFLDVRANGSADVVATFEADLSGLAGGAATVFASGLLGDDPAFGLFAALPDGTVAELPAVEFARLQVIHNSPSPTVDIYANGDLLLQGFEFRDATPFIEVLAGVNIDIAVAPGGSISVDDAIATFPVTFEAGSTNVAIANGIVGDVDNPFTIELNTSAKEAADDAGTVEFIAFHGSPGAPNVDIDARAVGTLVENLAFGDFSDNYLAVPPALYYLDVRVAGDPNIVATFEADLSSLAGGAATVFASGLLGDDPAFGLFAALPNGTVIELPATEVARLQVIHNSPSGQVDIYANGDLLVPDFDFRMATPFIFVPAGVNIDIAVAPGTSGSADDALATFPVQFDNGSTYVVVANGFVGSPEFPFNLEINDMGKEAADDPETVEIAAFHGSPGAPNVDVDARLVGTLFGDVEYSEFTSYLPVGPDLYYLDVRATGSPDVVATFEADLSGLAGGAATVFASGLLDGMPAFGLFAALPDGTVIELPATGAGRLQLIHASPTGSVDVYVDGALFADDFEYLTATPYFFLRSDTPYDFAIAPANSTSVDDAIFNLDNIVLEDREVYTAIAAGLVADATFDVFITDGAREIGTSATELDINVFHGISDAPAVNVDQLIPTANIATDLAFGEFSGYVNAPAITNIYEVTTTDGGAQVGDFFTNLEGGQTLAATVVATGTLAADDYNLYIVLANGFILPMVPATQAQVIHNSPSPIASVVDIYLNGGDSPAIDNLEFQTATPFTYFPARVPIQIGVAGGDSTGPGDILINAAPVTFDLSKDYVLMAAGIPGNVDTPFDIFVNDNVRTSALDPAQIDVLAFHGTPDAPGVDIDARGVGNLIDNIQFGEYQGYLSVGPDEYFLEVRPEGSDDLVATFAADLNGVEGASAVVFASGQLAGDPDFDLLAAFPSGLVVRFTPVSQVQVIHNSPTPTVDVYANGGELIPDFAFRTATPFVDLPTRVEIDLAVAPGDSQGAGDAIYNLDDVVLEDGTVYVIVATGVVGDATTPFDLAITDMGQTRAASGEGVDLLLYHGSTDAPTIDVVAEGVGILYDDVSYGEFDGYLNVPASTYVLNVTPGNDNDNIVKSYNADITGLEGGAGVVFASGFLGSMDMEDAFQVWVALPDGTTFPLDEIVGVNDLEGLVNDFFIAPNPVKTQANVVYTLEEELEVNLNIFDASGKLLRSKYMGNQAPNTYNEVLNVNDLPQGLYYYSIVTPQGILTKRFAVAK